MKVKTTGILFCVLYLFSWSAGGQTGSDSLFQTLLTFEYGQSPAVLERIERLVYACGSDVVQQQELAARLAAVLDAKASYAAKEFCCRQLALIGSEPQLPVLQRYVLDKAMSNIVLFALARFPESAKVDQALRQACRKSQGSVRMAVIKTIAVRRDVNAVDLLKTIVSKDKSDSTKNCALLALAHIGSEPALRIIEQAPHLGAHNDAMLLIADTAAPDQAAKIYDTLSQPGQKPDIRSAALAGLIRLGDKKANPLLQHFLSDADVDLFDAALGAVRRSTDAELKKQVVAQVASLPSPRQPLVIQALADARDHALAADVETWANSEDRAVRLADVEALGKTGAVSSVALLLQRAVAGEEAERKAAASSLASLRGIDAELVRLLESGGLDAARKVVVLSALTARVTAAAVPLILQNARDVNEQVRKESFKALYVLAGPQDLPSLLQLVLASPESSLPDAEKALAVVTKRLEHDQSFPEQLMADLSSTGDIKVKCSLLRILSGIGQQSTLPVIRQALQDKNLQVQETAIRGMSGWPNAVPADDLLLVSAKAKEPLHRILAMQGYLHIVSGDSTIAESAKALKYAEAIRSAEREQEKKLAFSHLARLTDIGALELVAPYLKDPAVCDEAAMAMISVGKKCWAREQRAVGAAMQAVDNSRCSAAVKVQARAVLGAFAKAKEFIVDWQAAGPFSIPSVPASLLFTLQLDAEYDWGSAVYETFTNIFDPDRPYYMDLAGTLKGQNHQTAYLRTNIRSPQQQQVLFIFGSDDGAKIWLNGKVVFARNTARTYQVDEDKITVTLQQGWNTLMIKIMQAEGRDWGASLRLVGVDGRPLPDLIITSDQPKTK